MNEDTASRTVSVVVPVYNMARFLETALQSVLDQTYPNITEIIVVNDDSSDESAAIARAMPDPRITVIDQDNRGPSGALNTGIRAATGDFIALLDGDDVWLPSKIAEHVAHLDRRPTVGVSFSPSAFIDEDGSPLGEVQSPRLTNIDIGYLMRCNPLGNGSAAVYRRDVFRDIEFERSVQGESRTCYFDESLRMSQDIELIRRIVLATPWLIEGLEEPTTLYRIGSGSVSSNLGKKVEVWEALYDRASAIEPELVAPHREISKAYELKYLARRAVRIRDGESALSLIVQSARSSPKILLEEPKSVIGVFGAAMAMRVLPSSVYDRLERRAAGRADDSAGVNTPLAA